jgi:phosphate transport system permease protein
VIDDFQNMAFRVDESGVASIFRLDGGSLIGAVDLTPDHEVTTQAYSTDGLNIVLGTTDGTVLAGTIGFSTEILDRDAVDESIRSLDPEALFDLTGAEPGLATVTPRDQIRVQKFVTKFQKPISLGDSPVARIGYVVTVSGPKLAAILEDGTAHLVSFTERTSMTTGRKTTRVKKEAFELDLPDGKGLPLAILPNLQGSQLFLVWQDGLTQRYNVRDFDEPLLVEEADLLEDSERSVSAVNFLLGSNTILIGDSGGAVSAWFTVRQEALARERDRLQRLDEPTQAQSDRLTQVLNELNPDGIEFALGHYLVGRPSPISRLQSSARQRMFISGHEDGSIDLHHVTAENHIASSQVESGKPIEAVAVSPKDDGLIAFNEDGYQYFTINANHPDISLKALFGFVHYEGYPGPAWVWQSSSGSDDAEPKLGLMPVIFGTIKATIYSLLIGVPLALLAAIYTSEFLHPKVKAQVKPTVELMASLPSVVLGFLAGIVFAPYVEKVLPAMLAQVFSLPLALLFGAYFWQLLPQRYAIQFAGWRFPLMFLVVVPLGIWFGYFLGPAVIEPWLFAGSVERWLSDKEFGSPLSGWLLIMLPLSAVVVAFLSGRVLTPKLLEMGHSWNRGQLALADLVKFIICLVATVGLAYVLSFLGSLIGDTRPSYPGAGDSFFGTYVSRNALVVGFAMGFAIIPIIYTIAEDALSTVPEHLRGASLGAGATQWQTATRIIIPTAMSGLFSAVMVGLGRAVGETMIVLMAAGNTPVLDWNIFNGFRTLSANIAVEMPEAVKDSTHYRTLFLCALVLFIMTFVLNTIAESVRQRFRKRAFQL